VRGMGVGALVLGAGTGDPEREGRRRWRLMAVEELGRRVERWVEAGAIGREQADAILALEGAAGREPGGGRRAVVVEVLGYLGGGLALVAGFAIAAESWDQLGYWGRVGVLAVVTAALLGARVAAARGRGAGAAAAGRRAVPAGAAGAAAGGAVRGRGRDDGGGRAPVRVVVGGGRGRGLIVFGAVWLELGRRRLVEPRPPRRRWAGWAWWAVLLARLRPSGTSAPR
jgi:hypothetical protein